MEKFEIKNGVLKKYNGTDTKVIIPDGVKVIGECAFAECVFEEGVFEKCPFKNGSCFHCHSLKEVIIPKSVLTIEKNAFSNCYLLKEIIIPEGVITIGNLAFNHCKSLEKIIIPNTVKK